jgi:hypothetical protein
LASLLLSAMALSACSILPPSHPGEVKRAELPYPRSRYIKAVRWDFSTVATQRKAHGSDLWPCAWARDGNLYCAWGDGGGFDGDSNSRGRVSLGFARIEGAPSADDPDTVQGKNVWGAAPVYAEHQAAFGGKVGTMTSVEGTLYAYGGFWTDQDTPSPLRHSGNGPQPTLIWSDDLGATWQMAPWRSNQLGSFLNYGQDNSAAPDAFIYIYYHRPQDPTRLYLMRVTKDHLKENPQTSSAYQYLTGVDAKGNARSWSASEPDAAPIFRDPRGVDTDVVYDAALDRILLTAGHNPGTDLATASAGQTALFEGPHPWGPWATVGYYDDWGELGSEAHGDYLGLVLPAKWMSPDGRTLWAIFSSLGQYDSFNFVKGTLVLGRAAAARAGH